MKHKHRYTVLPRTIIFIFKNDQLLLLKYSGRGDELSEEKVNRKDIYNPPGGHIEPEEDIIESAKREAIEETGIQLLKPKVKGVIHVTNFAGKNVMLFIVVGTTDEEPAKETPEGFPQWVDLDKIQTLPLYPDLLLLIENLQKIKNDQFIIGTSKYDGKFGLLDISLTVR